MAKAMFSKSLIQFFVEGWSCVPSLLFTWGQTMVEVMRIMVTSFKRSHDALLHPVLQPYSRPPPTHASPETPGHSWASLGQFLVWSLLLSPSPGAQGSLFLPSRNLFPQSCVSSGCSIVGLIVTSSKMAYAIPMSAAPRAPVPAAGHC